jgi:hypothetical protein
MTARAPRARPAARSRWWRLGLLALVIAGLGPGTFVRTSIGKRSDTAVVTVTPRGERSGVSGALKLTGVWQLTSPHGWFGGFSALAARGGEGLVAGTDRGFLLDIDLTGGTPRAVPGSFRFIGKPSWGGRTEIVDLESLAYDEGTGALWAAFEGANRITRLGPDGTRTDVLRVEMNDWSYNSGAETMARLADGRFVVIAEGSDRDADRTHAGLIFPLDPVDEASKPRPFRFAAPEDYDPVDADALPDGRVLILLRRVEYALPAARFDTAIAIADPRAIRAGEPWRAKIIARMNGGIFADNFEGIAFVPSPDDPARGSIWAITDDNMSVFQRSLLVRFDWQE